MRIFFLLSCYALLNLVVLSHGRLSLLTRELTQCGVSDHEYESG